MDMDAWGEGIVVENLLFPSVNWLKNDMLAVNDMQHPSGYLKYVKVTDGHCVIVLEHSCINRHPYALNSVSLARSSISKPNVPRPLRYHTPIASFSDPK